MSRAFAFADAAGNAFISVDGPGALNAIDGNRAHRAVPFALAAEETFLDGVLDVPRIFGRGAFSVKEAGFHYVSLRRLDFRRRLWCFESLYGLPGDADGFFFAISPFLF